MTQRAKAIGCGAILLWMFLPFIPVLVAGVTASAGGCDLDEGSVHSCIVLGKELGGLLYTMGVMGWLGLITFPTGIAALIGLSLFAWWQGRMDDPDQAVDRESGDANSTKQDVILWLGLASILCAGLSSIPALIIAARARPLATRAKLGAIVSTLTLITGMGGIVLSLLARP